MVRVSDVLHTPLTHPTVASKERERAHPILCVYVCVHSMCDTNSDAGCAEDSCWPHTTRGTKTHNSIVCMKMRHGQVVHTIQR